MNVYKVKGTHTYVNGLNEYTNGTETTCGFFLKEQLELIDNPVFGITYSSAYCTELPIDCYERPVLDVNGKRQCIKSIRFGKVPAYVMEDDTLSEEVTI